MSAGLRRSLLACAALLLAITVLAWRLDAALLQQEITDLIDHATGLRLQAKKAEVSLLHGISLKMENVTAGHAPALVHADIVYADVAVLPLLLGKIEIAAIYLHTPHIALPAGWSGEDIIGMLSRLSLDRIRIINGELGDTHGQPLLDDVQFDLRDIGPSREMRWEILAHVDERPISSHGKLQLRAGEVIRGFGKLKMDRVPLSRFTRFLPPWLSRHPAWLPPLLSSAITVDIGKNRAWSAFGDVTLDTGEKDAVPLTLRGKLGRNTDGEITWRDSFIHIGPQASLATHGVCRQAACEAELNGKGIGIATMISRIGMNMPVSGAVDMQANLRWQQGRWQGKVDTLWKNVKWRHGKTVLPVPELRLTADTISGDIHGNLDIADAWLGAKDAATGAQIQASYRTAAGWTAEIRMHHFETGWAPLANILLAAGNLPPGLRGDGPLNGRIDLACGTKNSMRFAADAGQLRLAYGTRFIKPAGIPMNMTGRLDWNETVLNLELESLRLSDSHLLHLTWKKTGSGGQVRHSLQIADADIHLDDLRQQSIRLPGQAGRMQGNVSGQISTQWREDEPDTAWLMHLDADASLHRFMTDGQQYSGEITARQGRFSSRNMTWSGDNGRASLQGYLDLAKQTGRIDIYHARLDWDRLSRLPKGWHVFDIRGRIDAAGLRLLANDWRKIRADYHLQHGQLHLRHVHADIAGGALRAKAMQFAFTPAGTKFSGTLQLGGLKLQQIQGLSGLIQAQVAGRLYANGRLEGTLPSSRLADWQGNGDIMIYQGKWEPNENLMHKLEKLVSTDASERKYAFRKFGFRFRGRQGTFRLSGLRLDAKDAHIIGKVSISDDGRLEGIALETNGRKYRIFGILPAVRWSEKSPTSSR
ncbi:MAG: YdbH domain-containing protein [Mariprofundaceae bacterium]|nr:YdbH domain-containing protein [Mariprofundaceae bacterium]